MSVDGFRPLSQLLIDDPDTSRAVIEGLRAAPALETHWNRTVPADLSRSARPTRLRDRTLVIHADSPVWASRIHHQRATLLRALRESGLDVSKLQVRVSSPPASSTAPAHRPRMSARTAGLLRATASSLSDPDLAEALRRLARHGA